MLFFVNLDILVLESPSLSALISEIYYYLILLGF